MEAYVLINSNGEALGIPSEPRVFLSELEATRVWAGMVLEALDGIRDSWGSDQKPSYEDLLEYPLEEALELGSTVYVDGVELRSYVVDIES